MQELILGLHKQAAKWAAAAQVAIVFASHSYVYTHLIQDVTQVTAAAEHGPTKSRCLVVSAAHMYDCCGGRRS
eukprot:COSAG05_NODE_443_length_9791_cov_14.720388_5_plen_73_part_00